MASSQAEPNATAKAFALRELAVCWNQAYEAMTQADLGRVAGLLDVAADHLTAAGDGRGDSAQDAALREAALAAKGRLEHGMRAGLDALSEELARARVGGKALRGYAQAATHVPTDESSRDV